MKKASLIMLIVFLLTGCGTKIDETQSKIIEEKTSDKKGEVDLIMEAENSNDAPKTITQGSEIFITNFVSDGTFWAKEINEVDEEYIIHADVNKNILYKELCSEFDGDFEYGIVDTYIVVKKDNRYYIYDIYTKENITNQYIGDYDGIYSLLTQEQNLVLVAKKEIESFEENYECVKLVDIFGNNLFEISLDKNTLLNEYGIEKYSYFGDNIKVEWIAEGIYCIPDIGDKYDSRVLNSLIIDLNQKRTIPVPFPDASSGVEYISDGNSTFVYGVSGVIYINNDTGDFYRFDSNYIPCKALSEGKFLSYGSSGSEINKLMILDALGNIVVDLNNYSSTVANVYSFKDGTALVQFTNGYVTHIDNTGKFLYEPIKGIVKEFYDDLHIAIVEDQDKIYLLDKDGNKENVGLLADREIFFIEYNGIGYFVEGGEKGLYVVEYNREHNTVTTSEESKESNQKMESNNVLLNEDIRDTMREASVFAWNWFWDSSREHIDENDSYLWIDENGINWEYKKVDYQGISSVEDVVNLAKHYFSEDVARELISFKQWYEIDNKVYVSEPEGVGGIDLDQYDIVIKKDTDIQYTITVYEYLSGELIGEPYDIHCNYINGYWVFDEILCQDGTIPINIVEEEFTNESMNIIGTWRNEEYNEFEACSSGYKTIFNVDGTIVHEGWRNKDNGTYEISENGKYVTVYYPENYIALPGEGWKLMENYAYAVNYIIDAENECLHAEYSKKFKELSHSNAEDGILIRQK